MRSRGRRARRRARLTGAGKSLVLLVQCVTHRHPDFWPNPEGFDPDRFLPDRVAERPRLAYFPSLGGPRICMEFALVEATLVLAMTTQRYRLHLLPGHLCTADSISRTSS